MSQSTVIIMVIEQRPLILQNYKACNVSLPSSEICAREGPVGLQRSAFPSLQMVDEILILSHKIYGIFSIKLGSLVSACLLYRNLFKFARLVLLISLP